MKIFKIKNKKDLLVLNKQFIISRLLIISLIYLFSFNEEIKNILLNFDATHYYNIALNGYTYDYQYAFFPLFPIVIRFFSYFNLALVGTVVFNILLSYLTTILIYKISKDIYKFEDNIVKNNIIFWLSSPVALFTVIPYTESLFIFLTTLCFYLYKTTNKPFLIGIILGLTILTRSFGAMLFFSIFITLIIKLYKNCRIDKSNFLKDFTYIVKMYIPATIIACLFPTYLFISKGNFLYFIEVQFTEWSRIKSNFFFAIAKEFQKIKDGNVYPFLNILNLIMLIVIIVIILYLVFMFIKTKNQDAFLLILFLAFSFVSCFSTIRNSRLTSPTCSMYRYLLSFFPIYLFPKKDLARIAIMPLFFLFNILIIFFFSINIFFC